jgi:hypothetical protein
MKRKNQEVFLNHLSFPVYINVRVISNTSGQEFGKVKWLRKIHYVWEVAPNCWVEQD